jgi:hypothetical protein
VLGVVAEQQFVHLNVFMRCMGIQSSVSNPFPSRQIKKAVNAVFPCLFILRVHGVEPSGTVWEARDSCTTAPQKRNVLWLVFFLPILNTYIYIYIYIYI